MAVKNTYKAVRTSLRIAPAMPRNRMEDAHDGINPKNLGITKPRFSLGVANALYVVFLSTGPLGLQAM